MTSRRIAIAILLLTSGAAHACLFATKTPPQGWYQWSVALFAGDVTAVERDREKPVDIITVRVVEVFKGPDAPNATLTVHISSRHWTTCKAEVPASGARVLVGMNANSDAMLVPLSAGFAEQLRGYGTRLRQPPTPK
ncbi:MAG TPA: hypothetical protein VFR66_10215 [Burkholderiales bacterium]|nr:hypothetical protein [Burkholderiales bacterium]